MARPRKDAHLGHEAKARIVSEALLSGNSFASIASKHGISKKTLERWRTDLEHDPVLLGLVAKAQVAIRSEWGDEVPACLRDAIKFLRRSAAEGNPCDPDMVEAVSGALVKVSEVAATWKIIDARLAESNRQAGSPARPVVGTHFTGGPAPGTSPAEPTDKRH